MLDRLKISDNSRIPQKGENIYILGESSRLNRKGEISKELACIIKGGFEGNERHLDIRINMSRTKDKFNLNNRDLSGTELYDECSKLVPDMEKIYSIRVLGRVSKGLQEEFAKAADVTVIFFTDGSFKAKGTAYTNLFKPVVNKFIQLHDNNPNDVDNARKMAHIEFNKFKSYIRKGDGIIDINNINEGSITVIHPSELKS